MAENNIIKRQNRILHSIRQMFEKAYVALEKWKEWLNDFRREQGRDPHYGRNDLLIEEQERLLSETSKELEQMEIMDRRIKELEADCQKWYELASKLNSENRLLQKQNVELLKLSGQ